MVSRLGPFEWTRQSGPASSNLNAFMTTEERDELIRRLQQGEDLSPEWARILFPPEKREYELVYHGKEREEDILAETLAVPLQPVRTFAQNGGDWQNMLIFGDNLQVMKSLLDLKKRGKLCSADGTTGVRLVYIDPPFATKQEFSGSDDQKAYQDKMVGAEFLEFLRKRLVMIRELMSADASISVHVDWKKSHSSAERVPLDASPASWAAFWRIRSQHQVKTGGATSRSDRNSETRRKRNKAAGLVSPTLPKFRPSLP